MNQDYSLKWCMIQDMSHGRKRLCHEVHFTTTHLQPRRCDVEGTNHTRLLFHHYYATTGCEALSKASLRSRMVFKTRLVLRKFVFGVFDQAGHKLTCSVTDAMKTRIQTENNTALGQTARMEVQSDMRFCCSF